MYNKLIYSSFLCIALGAPSTAFGMEKQELKVAIHYNNKKSNKWVFYNTDGQRSTCPFRNADNPITINPNNYTLHYNDMEQKISLNHIICNDLYQEAQFLNINDELSPKLIKLIDKKLSQPEFRKKTSKIYVHLPDDNISLCISNIKNIVNKRTRSNSTPDKRSIQYVLSDSNTDSGDDSSCSESRDDDPTNISAYIITPPKTPPNTPTNTPPNTSFSASEDSVSTTSSNNTNTDPDDFLKLESASESDSDESSLVEYVTEDDKKEAFNRLFANAISAKTYKKQLPLNSAQYTKTQKIIGVFAGGLVIGIVACMALLRYYPNIMHA